MIDPSYIAIEINRLFRTLALDLPVNIVLSKKTYKVFIDHLKEQEKDWDIQSSFANDRLDFVNYIKIGLKPNQFRFMGILFEEEA